MFMSECSSPRTGPVCVVSIISCIQNKLIRVHTVLVDASEKKKKRKIMYALYAFNTLSLFLI